MKSEPAARLEEGGEGSKPGRWGPWILVVVLIVIPGALYSAVPVVVFLPLGTAQKVGISGALVVAAEAVFWGAALFLGTEVISRYRRYFDPRTWRR